MKENFSTLRMVKAVLKKHHLNHLVVPREKLKPHHYRNIDVIIAVGGDGTFLRTAQGIMDTTPLLGVNANPAEKEGFFMQTDKQNVEQHLRSILSKTATIKKLPRLIARINDKILPPFALNEFYVGTKKAYCMFRYTVNVGGKEEAQKSSGILVGTAASSYAWLGSAGGKRMSLGDTRMQYVVREPYEGNIHKHYTLTAGTAKKITISAISPGILVADSVGKEFAFKPGATITIVPSPRPLSVYFF